MCCHSILLTLFFYVKRTRSYFFIYFFTTLMVKVFHCCYSTLFLCVFHFFGVLPTVLEILFVGIIWSLDERFLPQKKICIYFCQVPGGHNQHETNRSKSWDSQLIQKVCLKSHLLLVQPDPKGVSLWASSILWGRSLIRLCIFWQTCAFISDLLTSQGHLNEGSDLLRSTNTLRAKADSVSWAPFWVPGLALVLAF